jgi:hypothetical protein
MSEPEGRCHRPGDRQALADLADMGVRLLSIKTGMPAPHFSYMRGGPRRTVGDVSVHCNVHWDHSWVKGTVLKPRRI